MYKTLIETLKERSKLDNKGVTFIEGSDKEETLSYEALYFHALHILSFLQEQGLKPKDELVFQLDDNKTFVIVFWACILGGIIPVPLMLGKNDDHRKKLFNVWEILKNPYLIVSQENLNRLKKYGEINGYQRFFDSPHEKFILVEDIYNTGNEGVIYAAEGHDIAYVQFSSGSTGNPKGVVLTHKNLITNMKAISEASLYNLNDSKLSWMPLTHDMGLIGFHLCPLFFGINHYLLPTSLFIRRPALWLDKASRHKATILCSPNFGYKYLLKQINHETDYNWDLSEVRMVYNGAEPISEGICHEFVNTLTKYGLKPTSMYPVYGLAEASLAVSFSRLEDEVTSLGIDRTKTGLGDTIAISTKGDSTVPFVNVGNPVPYCSIQIADDYNKACKEGIIGHIQIKGGNVTSGYYNNPIATEKALTKDGWLDTGDLGFMHDGSLYVTGRSKDIIFINGQNYYPHDIETSLEIIDNIELGKVVAAGYTGQKTGEEEVAIFVLFKGKTEKFIDIHNKINGHINRMFGFVPGNIVPVREIPKTTSGKVQRFRLIDRLNQGTYNDLIDEIHFLLNCLKDQEKFIAPTNETEKKLVEIWSGVLSHEDFGTAHKFFEIGGNSLKGAQVLTAIHREFGVELDYNMLFERQSIREIAKEISQHKITQYEPISKVKDQRSYSLSSAQRRLYYLWEVDKPSVAYNIPLAFSIKGNLDINRLEKAIIQMSERHEILRAFYYMSNGEPCQKFIKNIDFKLAVTKIELKNIKNGLRGRVKPYDLNSPPLFRAELFEVPGDGYFLFLDFHHIISDGVSISLFVEELFKIYHGEGLTRLEVQYRDYIYWENRNLKSEAAKSQGDFWLRRFNDKVPVLNLPTDFSRPPMMDYHGEKFEFKIDNRLNARLKDLAKAENTSLFVVLLAAYNVLLSKYTGQEDIVTGVPVAGRGHVQLQSLQGMFVNNLAMRNFPQGHISFKEFLNQVRHSSLQALNNKDYPFGDLVRQIGQKRDVSRNSLFDTMFIFQNMEFPQIRKNNLSVEHFFFDPGFSKYDISLEVFDKGDGLYYYIEYSSSLFEKSTVIRFANHFENLINEIIKTPNAKLSCLSIIDSKEYNGLVSGFNETKCDYPRDKVIHQLIEEQAVCYPNNIAVIVGNSQNGLQTKSFDQETGDRRQETEDPDSRFLAPGSFQRLTYKELNNKSGQLANFLRKKSIAPNIPVAVVLDRSPELIIAVLGILKAGGCYLPIDKDLPEERIKYILGDSQTNLVISDFEVIKNEETVDSRQETVNPDSRLLTSDSSKNIEYINIFDKEIYAAESKRIDNINTPNNLAYIIYTSGTTGNPKGVMVKHQSLVNYASFANKTYIKGEKVSFPLYTSISFDLTVTSVFTPLISGSTIVTYPDNEKSFPLEDVIGDNQIQIIKATPSHLKMLKENRTLKDAGFKSNIKRFIVGGEALTSQLAKEIYYLFDKKVGIYNEYGPTEATVGCMIYKYDEEKDKKSTISIGIPADNSQIYLLDKYLKPVPIGVVGEIYISGDCLSGGYLFNPRLTDEKFIQNPFATGQKMYKTGDLAKWLPNGNIEFIGRSDQQIKINGYRVEMEEIEQQVLKCQGVSEAVVVCKDESLCAYVVSDEDINSELRATSYKSEEITTSDHVITTNDPLSNDLMTNDLMTNDQRIQSLISGIKQHLSIHLPHYMLPKHIISIDTIPLTKNGKIDYSQLPVLQQTENVKEKAKNEIQEVMVSVWQDVLNENEVGITGNFFELGGDSIKAVQISSRLFDKNISVNVKDILTYQTIEQLCLYAKVTDTTIQYEQGIIKGEVGLNPIQRWFFEQNFKNPHFYNQSILLQFKKPINKEILQKTFEILIKHHDGLRMNYDPEKKVMFYNNSHLDNEFVVEEYLLGPQASSYKLQANDKAPMTTDQLSNDKNIQHSSAPKPMEHKANTDHSTSGIRYPASGIQDICQQIKSSFNIENSLLIKAAIIKEENTDFLFITAHHLIIDGVSWRVILEDLYTIYNSIEKGKEVKLPQKTASLIDGGNRLLEYADSDELQSQVEYWSEIENTNNSSSYKVGLVKDLKQKTFRLGEEETRFLLTGANKAYNTNVEILLVTALTQTLREWKNFDEVVVEMESHGRHFEDIDIARTTGWFTSMFPVRFKPEHKAIGEQIKHVKEQIRNIPGKGLGYGVLKYANKALKGKAGLKTLFNYLGQFGNELSNDLFEYQQEVKGEETDGKNPITTWLEVNAMVVNNELVVEINSTEGPDSFIGIYQNNLRHILEHLREEQDIHFTPSDFDAVELDEEDLRVLFG